MEDVMSIQDSKKDEDKDQPSLITRGEVDTIIRETGFTKFGQIQSLVSIRIGRAINYSERKHISDSLRAAYCTAAEVKRDEEDEGHRGVLLFTAYTEDYSIGRLCDKVNRRYAAKHGYKYVSEVLSYDDMMGAIGPLKTHCTWFKVLMLTRFLEDQADMLQREGIQYLMWIDADAVVIDDSVRVEDIIHRGRDRDLIIAENMHAGCLVNAGVMLVRVSEWSKQLWREVWDCNKYSAVTFYEQSALIRRLRAKREGLEMLEERQPFHSYLPGALKGVKLFAHVAVLPHLELNTNSGWLCEGRQIERGRGRRMEKATGRLNRQRKEGERKEGSRQEGGTSPCEEEGEFVSEAGQLFPSRSAYLRSEKEAYEVYLKGEQMPSFIFHAAGHCGKLVSLKGVLQKRGIIVPDDFLALDSFSLPKGDRSSLPQL